MKKRGRRARSERRSFRFINSRDVYNRLRGRVFTREVTFILLVLFGGMIFFDAVGYDYTGMVVQTNYLTGQPAGIPDDAISNIGDTMKSIFKLIFGGFLDPALGIFGDNKTVATKLTLFVIVFLFILPVCKKIFKIEEGAKTINSASVVAALISLLGIGLLPSEFVKRLSDTVPIILVVGFLAGVLYGLFKWKTEEKIASFIKGLVSLATLLFLTYILGAFGTSPEGATTLDSNLSGAIWVIAGFGYLILAWLFFEGVFIKPFAGEAKSASDVAEEYVERRRDVAEARNIKEGGKLERVGIFKQREDMKFKRKAPEKIRRASDGVYSFLKDVESNITKRSKVKSVVVGVEEVLSYFKNDNNPNNRILLDKIEKSLISFQDLSSNIPNSLIDAEVVVRRIKSELSSIRANLQQLTV